MFRAARLAERTIPLGETLPLPCASCMSFSPCCSVGFSLLGMDSGLLAFQKLALQDPVVERRPWIPQEVADIIIDHLFDDNHALHACALVSNDWLWSARYHLFHHTVITTSVKKRGLDAFLELVSSSPFQLGTHVRCLHVRGAHDKSQDDFSAILRFLSAILPRLPSIRKISLSQMVWGQTPQLPQLHVEQMPWELDLLTLKDIRLEASDRDSLDTAQRHLSHLLHQCSTIRLLTIDTVRIGYRALYQPPTGGTLDLPSLEATAKCRVSALNCFTEDDSFYLLAALSRLGFAQTLQTLKFGSGCPEITASAQVVTDLAASSLRFVRYRVPSDDYGEFVLSVVLVESLVAVEL